MTQFSLSLYWEKKLRHFDLKSWVKFEFCQWLNFLWLNFFYRCTDRKIESFWHKNLGQILVPPVAQLLGSKWLNYFSRCTERKIESFWPKKLGQILVPPVTQLKGQNDSIFSLGALSQEIESFWPKKLARILIPPVTQLFESKWLNIYLKSWVEFLFRQRLNF